MTARFDTDLAMGLRLVVARLQRLLRQQGTGGLTLTQLSSLATILREGPIPMTALAARENLSAPTITKIATNLEARGLVRREMQTGDRRVNLLVATRKGRALVDGVRERRTVFLNARLSRLSQAQIETLAAAIPVLEVLATDDDGRPE